MHPKHYEFDYFSEYPTLKVTVKIQYSHRIERRTHAWRGREVLFLPYSVLRTLRKAWFYKTRKKSNHLWFDQRLAKISMLQWKKKKTILTERVISVIIIAIHLPFNTFSLFPWKRTRLYALILFLVIMLLLYFHLAGPYQHVWCRSANDQSKC